MPSVSHYLNANSPRYTLSKNVTPHYGCCCAPRPQRLHFPSISRAECTPSFTKDDAADACFKGQVIFTNLTQAEIKGEMLQGSPLLTAVWNHRVTNGCSTLCWVFADLVNTGICEHTDGNSMLSRVLWELVFCQDSGFDKKMWVND